MALDALGRRSRFLRTPTGKRLVLGQRDIEILRWLYRYRYLRQSHLEALLQPKSMKRFAERLGDLYHETGFINRPEADVRSFDLRAQSMLYEITSKGIEWLAAAEALRHRAVTFSLNARLANSSQMPHTMMIIETLVATEMKTMATDGQRFVPVDEILARAPEATRAASNPLAVPTVLIKSAKHHRSKVWLIPDALYGIEYQIDGEPRYRFWALECERTSPAWRSNTRMSSTAKKHAAYDALIASGAHRKHWAIPCLELEVVRFASATVFRADGVRSLS